MKKQLTFALALAALLLAAASCGDTADNGTQTEQNTADTVGDTAAVETANPYDPGLGERDFNGYTFTFAVRGQEGNTYAWNNVDIVVEEETGEALDDAIYKRNLELNEMYNVNIGVLFCGDTGSSTSGSPMYNKIRTSVMAADNAFDAILSSPYDSIGYVLADFVIDLNELPNLNLSQPWWDQKVQKDLIFGSKVYLATGDITYIDNKATHVIAFNKKLIADFDIADPYETVTSGKWTIDTLIENSKLATKDLNGDGKMDHNDRYGFMYWQDAVYSFITSTDNAIGRVNEKGEPELALNTERMVNMWDKMIDFISAGDAVAIKDYLSYFDNSDDKVRNSLFDGDQALYTWASVNAVINMRTLDVNFGIIPFPKYDEAQTEYITPPHPYGNTLMSVPTTITDPDRTGFILEAFAAKSAELVTPAFYEKTLVGKSVRDAESEEMLDLIFANKFYDIGIFFAWGDYKDNLMNSWNARKSDFSSLYEKHESAALKDIEKIAEYFE